MPLPTSTTTPGRVRHMPPLQGVRPLPAGLLDLVPEKVRQASEAHGARLDEIRRLKDEANAAKVAAEAAKRHDDAGAVEAVEKGKPVPDRTYPAALAAADAAARAIAGAQELARRSQHEFISSMAEAEDELVAAVDAALGDLAREAGELVDAIENLLVRRRDLALLQRELSYGVHPMARSQTFGIDPPTRRGPLGPDQRKFLDGLRQVVAGA